MKLFQLIREQGGLSVQQRDELVSHIIAAMKQLGHGSLLARDSV